MPPEPSIQAERIRDRMSAMRLNPYSAAKKAGLGESFVRDILRGKVKSPSAERLAKLAEALECSVNFLLGLPEPEFAVGALHNFALGVDEIPSPLARSDADSHQQRPGAVLLPIRFELMTSAFRRRGEIERDLGFEVASSPPSFDKRAQWFEVVRDTGADLIAPAGSLLQVAELTEADRSTVADGDVVIIEKHLIGPSAAYYLVERSVRVVKNRYPDLGLWFYEYASTDHEYWGISDDIFLDENNPDPKPLDLDVFRDLLEEFRHLAGRLDASTLQDNEAAFESLLQQRKSRPRLMGKVLRALVPIDPQGGFGLTPQAPPRKFPS
ncbi:hypothetical protein SGCZBJ_03730 [Caulobacter zeae]|uniref:HTH cro/C1-type domain-containing protein n=1 Tax=Caulobacter zeae TaxID=2055137 RepID=A0A2N5DPZ2_9CAUL|nr:helix-turn-helix domain-containing protein [Caulobacter zeae]PLR28128.1 hypothetical protein SGCZBJ_03730 [Caulobacter zeae]